MGEGLIGLRRETLSSPRMEKGEDEEVGNMEKLIYVGPS